MNYDALSSSYYHLGLISFKEGKTKEAIRLVGKCRELDDAYGNLSGVMLCDELLNRCNAADPGSGNRSSSEPENNSCWDVPETLTQPEAAEEPIAGPVPPTRSVNYKQRELVYLASFSEETNNKLFASLEKLGDKFGRPVSINRIAYGSHDPAKRIWAEREFDQHVCANIVILE